jgi:hypothetical protein
MDNWMGYRKVKIVVKRLGSSQMVCDKKSHLCWVVYLGESTATFWTLRYLLQATGIPDGRWLWGVIRVPLVLPHTVCCSGACHLVTRDWRTAVPWSELKRQGIKVPWRLVPPSAASELNQEGQIFVQTILIFQGVTYIVKVPTLIS